MFGEQVAPDISGQVHGIALWRADVDLHNGRFSAAANRVMEIAIESFWWRTVYHAARAETFARAGRADSEEAIALAREFVGENRYAEALLRRAEGNYGNDTEMLSAALQIFEQIECPTRPPGWLIGGAARQRAGAVFERLGAVEPAD